MENPGDMKLIGILGGMSWMATEPYYRRVNEIVLERLGPPNSARVMLYSVNFGPMKSLFHHGWDRIPELFATEYAQLATTKPDCILMACNTLHKAYNLMAEKRRLGITFLHVVDLTLDHCLSRGFKRPLFLGTSFTMTDDYFKKPLADAGIEVVLPNAQQQEELQTIHDQIASNVITREQSDYMRDLVAAHDVDSVILACTEYPLVFLPDTTTLPVVNPMELQCQAAVDLALAK